MQDILQALIEYYNKDRPMAYDTLTDFIELFQHNPTYSSYNLLDLIKTDSLEHHLCPMCYSEIHIKTDKNQTVEYQGMPTNELISYSKCNSCGWDSRINDID